MIVMALGCLASVLFVNYVLRQREKAREVAQALDDSNILRFAFETAALA